MSIPILLAAALLSQDAGTSKLLAELLAPPAKALPVLHLSAAPRRLVPPRTIETPDLPLPLPQAEPSRSSLLAPAKPLRPHPLPEGLPLTHQQRDPVSPQPITLPVGERVRLPFADINEPIALPKLTVRPVDATLSEDPTAAASTAAALSAAPPLRANPAPFLRLTLPDPFEHRDVLRLPRPNTDAQPPAPAPVRLPEYKR